MFDEITLFERKVPWRHLVHENLTGFKEMFISSDTFSMAHRLPHRVGGRAFREAADDVQLKKLKKLSLGAHSEDCQGASVSV